MTADPALAALFVRMARQAGALIMTHYGNAEARMKADESPVTAADEAAEALILEGLAAAMPMLPVVSEEAASQGRFPPASAEFVLVDPLDGTKEFLKRNGQFTVNIALVRNGEPVVGVVYAPAAGRLFWTDGRSAFEASADPGDDGAAVLAPLSSWRIEARAAEPGGVDAVVSGSHADAGTDAFLARYAVRSCRAIGSSLKFCAIAAGKADLYPRLGRTMEWDTAAGHAVLRAAGGTVETLDGAPLRYGKAADGFANPHFVAHGKT